MPFTGTRSGGGSIIDTVQFFSGAAGAMTAAQVLAETTVAHYGRIGGIIANAVTAGTGGGNTVLDVLLNGTSIFTVTASRPTLLATSTGNFTSKVPNTRGVKPGDRITVICLSVSTTGHARVSGEVCLEDA